MGAAAGPNIVEDGLVLALDAGNTQSYPGSGTTWSDLTSNSHDLTLTNGPTYSSTDGGIFDFDGTDDYATTSGSSTVSINASQDFSFDAWIKIDDGGINSISNIGDYYLSSGFVFYTAITTRNLSVYTNNALAFSSGAVTLNAWAHVAFSRSGSTVTVYLNTSSVGTFTHSAPLIFGSSYMTIKGLYTVAPVWNNFDVFFIALIIALVVIYFFNKFAKRKQEEEGKQYPRFLISLGIFIIIPALTFIVGGVDLSWSFPELKQLAKTSFTFEGGLGIPPELIALTLALTLYTATFIAENVRAGIQGIGKGQKEAAASIGLTPSQVLKLVVMPQALRIIIPPTTNQYLNLTKNSSLAAAIAYPDLVLVFAGTAMMQTGRAIEIVGITMATYLTISLSISAFMNWYNKRIAIQEK